MALTKVTGELINVNDLDLTNVGTIQADSIAGDADTNTALTFSGSDVITVTTGGSTAFTVDASQVVNLSQHLTLVDDKKIKLGAGDDLQIYHDASNSYIKDTGTGALEIWGSNINIRGTDGGYLGRFTSESWAGLFHNNAEKFRTTSSGVSVTGNIANSSGDLTLDVAGDIILDADGGDFFFKDGGTEHGYISTGGNILGLTSSVSDDDIVFTVNDGGTATTALTIDGSDAGTATFNHDIKLGDNGEVVFGAGDDLKIYHDASAGHSYIKDAGTGNLSINTDSQVNMYDTANSGWMSKFIGGGAVELYHAGSKKIETTSGGVDVTGLLTVSKSVYGDFDAENFYRIKFEDAGGVHNDVGIGQTASGSMGFNTTASGSFIFNDGTNGNILSLSNGAANFDGTISVGGTSSRTLGPVTGSYGTLQVSGSGAGGYEGLAIDGRVVMMHDGGSIFGFYNDLQDEWLARHDLNGSTLLYYDGGEVFKTNSAGVNITGKLAVGKTTPSTTLDIDSGSDYPTMTIARSTTHSGLSFTAGISDFTGGGADLLFDGVGNETGFGFRVKNSSGTQLNALVLAPDGNVGLGTHSPDDGIHIKNAQHPRMTLESTSSSSYKTYIENRYDASNTINWVWNTTTLMRFTSNYNALALMPGNDPGVAIGTYDDEGHKLNIYRGSSGDCSVNIKASGSGDATLIMDNGAANRDNIIRFKEQGTQVGQITYVCNGDYLKFSAGSNNNSSKFIVYGTGDAHIERRLGIGSNTGAASDIAIRTATGTSGSNWRFGGHVTNTLFYLLNEDNDGVYMSHGSSSWVTHSDERIKENITSLGTVLPDLVNMRCVKYNRKGKSDTKIGFIAQDWESKFPEIVDEDDGFRVESDGSIVAEADTESTDKVKAVSYTETIPILLKAIQELEARITELESN